jgi:membrane-associated protein
MELIHTLIDYVLHLDAHLAELVRNYGAWVYLILFLVIFCETGLVVTPFLPGDSLLFAVGALAATGVMNIWLLYLLLAGAAILGNTTNYAIGYTVGAKAVARGSRFIKPQYLERTHAFYEKYGGKTLILTRFVPIIRTFAPFVAGLGKMTWGKFTTYNVAGGLLWVTPLLFGGYLFGNIPAVKENFGIVVIAIIAISLLPAVIEYIKHRRQANRALEMDPK